MHYANHVVHGDHDIDDIAGFGGGPYTLQNCIDMCNSIEACVAFSWINNYIAPVPSCWLKGGSMDTNELISYFEYSTYVKTCTGGSDAPALQCTEGFVELPEGESCNTPDNGYEMVATEADCERHAAATGEAFRSVSADEEYNRGGCMAKRSNPKSIFYNDKRKDSITTDDFSKSYLAVCCRVSSVECESFLKMTANTNECVGSSTLTTKSQCDAATRRLSTNGQTITLEENVQSYPKGCYYFANSDTFFWNTHTSGQPHSSSQPICCANPPESGANPPESSSSKSNTGLIIGVSLGAVVLVAVVGCILSVRRSGQTIGGNDWRNKLLSLI